MIKKIVIVVLILIVGFSIYFAFVFSGMEDKLAAVELSEVDLSKIEDGIYKGEEKVGLVAAIVEVEVKDNKISSIKLVDHRNWRGKPAEVIIDKVIEEQKINVDTISGATASSKVILKAIENSLK